MFNQNIRNAYSDIFADEKNRATRARNRRKKIRLIHFDKHPGGSITEYLGFGFTPDTLVTSDHVVSVDDEPGFLPFRFFTKRSVMLRKSISAVNFDIQITRPLPFSVFSFDIGSFCYNKFPIEVIGEYARGGEIKKTFVIDADKPMKVQLNGFDNLSVIHIREDKDVDLQLAKTAHPDSIVPTDSFGICNILIKLSAEKNLEWPEVDGDFRTFN